LCRKLILSAKPLLPIGIMAYFTSVDLTKFISIISTIGKGLRVMSESAAFFVFMIGVFFGYWSRPKKAQCFEIKEFEKIKKT
jgi:hypothetical protein